MHPELRVGVAEEHILRLAEDMRHPNGPGTIRRALGRLLTTRTPRSAHPQGCAPSAPKPHLRRA